MADAYCHNNPRDPTEERFERLEVQFVDISRNMNLLTVALAINLKPFGGDGVSNSDIGSEGKSGYREDSRKES
jgi:hypothetical protein